MAPVLLKIKGNKCFSSFSNLDSEEDLSKTWRVCSKVSDSLENGPRLENLSWRLWFRQHALHEKSPLAPFQSLSKSTTLQLDHHHAKLGPLKNNNGNNKRKRFSSTKPQQLQTLVAMVMPKDIEEIEQTPSSSFQCGYDMTNTNRTGFEQAHDETQLMVSTAQQQQLDPNSTSSIFIPSSVTKQQQPPSLTIDTNQTITSTNNFSLQQYTTPNQTTDQVVGLDSIFDTYHRDFFQQQDGKQVETMGDDTTPWTGVPATTNLTNTNDSTSSTSPSFAQQYFTPVSSPLGSNAYHHQLQHASIPLSSPATTTTFYPQHNRHRQYHQQQQQVYSPSVTSATSYGMPLSMPSSPSFISHPQQLQLDHDHLSARTNEAMYVSSSSSMLPPLPTGTLGMKLIAKHGIIPQQQQSSYSTNDDLTLPMSSTTSDLSSANNMEDFSLCNMVGDLTCASATATTVAGSATMDMDSNLPGQQPYHQRNFPASAPTTPPLHQHIDHIDTASKQSDAKMDTATSVKKETAQNDDNDDDDDDDQPMCTNCEATSTPLWRRSCEDELLCNACGLYEKLHNAPRPKSLKPHNSRKEIKEEDAVQLVCSNCMTTNTPLWRRDDEGASLCNACGLYLKLHHEKRPLSMKTDTIKKRQRYEGNGHHNGRKYGRKSKGANSGESHATASTTATTAINSTTTPCASSTSSTSSLSSSSSSLSAPPSPETAIGKKTPAITTLATNIIEEDYPMLYDIYPASTPSSPTSSPSHHSILPTSYGGYIHHQHQLPSFMN